MPFISNRAEQLQELRQLMTLQIMEGEDNDALTSSSGSSDSSSSETDSDSEDDVFFLSNPDSELAELMVYAESTRYWLERFKIGKSGEFAREFFWDMSNDFFRHVTRMNKDSFWTLLSMIESHPVFHNRSRNKQAPVCLQLAVTLDRLGHYGNGAALRRSALLWGKATGSIIQFMHLCLTALEVALHNAVIWPDEVERARISSEFAKMGFPGCVGLVDGTLIPLTQRPKMDGEVYFDRKKRYSINMQVICDDRKRILHIYAGPPGSSQDSSCLKSSPFWEFRTDPRTFSAGQYLLGDSGYNAVPSIVSAFRYGAAGRDANKEAFNFCLAKTRVSNEHCIGILKSRWHALKEMKTQLKSGPPTSKWMIRQIECCVRLHNFVSDQQDEWTEEDDEIQLERGVPTQVNNLGLPVSVDSLRMEVMETCLSINRRPGGLLNTV